MSCRSVGALALTGTYLMKPLLIAVALLSLSTAAGAQTAKVTPLFTHDLPDITGKEGMILTVEYPPGGTNPVHRHNANVFVYVLEGSIVMQVKGEDAVTLHAGQTFYEAPNDVHLVGRNASKTEPAKFLAFFVKDKGAPPVAPAE